MKSIIIWLLPLWLALLPAAHAEKANQNKNFIIPIPVDVNQADAETLDRVMDGIGPKKAEAIIQYREMNGPFSSVDELANVKGIGPGTLKRNSGRITVK